MAGRRSEDTVPPLPTSFNPTPRSRINSLLQSPAPAFLRRPSVQLGAPGPQPSTSSNTDATSTVSTSSNSIFRRAANSVSNTARRARSASESIVTYPPARRSGYDDSDRLSLGARSLGGRSLGRGRSLGEATAAGKTRMKRALSAMTFWNSGADNDQPLTEEETEARRIAEERSRHDQQVVDLLDVIDPEVGVLTTLSDLQNSLFVPDLGRFVDRSRFLRLTRPDKDEMAAAAAASLAEEDATSPISPTDSATTAVGAAPDQKLPRTATQAEKAAKAEEEDLKKLGELATAVRGKYLILPKGLVDWDHWTEEEKAELDDYVRHLLHSKKWKAKRAWRGFKQYCSTPLGAFITIYATLLTFWGAAWVLFIIGWLHAGDRQSYFVEICDQILTALFCVVGIGLAPFRVVDTYHMIYIAHYHRKSLRLYRERGAPPLRDENDLPSPNSKNVINAEEGRAREPVLTVKQQALLIYHETKFQKSHSFYRPHETFTHRAFPLDLLIVIVCILDFHSIFQIALGSTTWSISYHHDYKKILTSIILSFSISCNITAGLIITVGNRRTRKEEIVTALLHKAVTEEAVKRKQEKRARELALEEERRGLVRERVVEDREKVGRPFLG